MGTELRIERVSVERGALTVVRKASLVCPPGEVTVLLGANGAGKTSLLDAVSGVIPLKSGEVTMGGDSILRLTRDRRAGKGLSYVEQGRSIFGSLTVDENLALPKGPKALPRAYEMFPELEPRRKVAAQMLSGGEQQMLVLARAMVSEPEVLLIDEMSQGLAPVIVKRLMPFVRDAARAGIAVLLVEQFASIALRIGTRGYVMSVGGVSLEDSCKTLLDHPEKVREAYLSGGREHTETLSV